MPSMLHEALVALFRNRPELAPELLRDVLHVPLPAYSEIRFESAQLSDVMPADYRADLVVLLVKAVPVLAVVVEVQLGPDQDKRFTWPAYLAGFRRQLRCDAMLLVVCPDPVVARWCAEPIITGHPGWAFVPVVLGPETVPVVTQADRARQAPELAVLSVLAHARGSDGERIAAAALEGAATLDEDKSKFYTDLVLMVLPEAARSALEAMMTAGSYEYQSELVKRWVREVQQGKAEGKTEGKAEGKADALLELLEARGLIVSEAQRQRITSCRDLAQLSAWLRRALTASSASELFA